MHCLFLSRIQLCCESFATIKCLKANACRHIDQFIKTFRANCFASKYEFHSQNLNLCCLPSDFKCVDKTSKPTAAQLHQTERK